MKNKLRTKWQMSLEIASIPIALIIYIVDRIGKLFLIWMPVDSIQKWIYDDEAMIKSTFRVILYSAIYGLIQLFYWL